jgi:hypothetical protein
MRGAEGVKREEDSTTNLTNVTNGFVWFVRFVRFVVQRRAYRHNHACG